MIMYELMALEKPFANVHVTQRWECTMQGKIPELTPGTRIIDVIVLEAQSKFRPLIELWIKCISIDADVRPPAKKLIKKLSEFL